MKNKDVTIEYYKSEKEVADIFRKPLKCSKFKKLKMKLGMTGFENPNLRGDGGAIN